MARKAQLNSLLTFVSPAWAAGRSRTFNTLDGLCEDMTNGLR